MKTITAIWDGEAEVFRPTPRYRRHCNATYVDEDLYVLEVGEYASEATRRHYFASLRTLWENLPDDLALQFLDMHALRKHALIMCGYRRERKFALSTKEDARKMAAALKPQTVEDDYAIISVNENVVIEWKAMSQSRKAMPEKGQFGRSKTAVLEWCSALIGVKPSDVQESA